MSITFQFVTFPWAFSMQFLKESGDTGGPQGGKDDVADSTVSENRSFIFRVEDGNTAIIRNVCYLPTSPQVTMQNMIKFFIVSDYSE